MSDPLQGLIAGAAFGTLSVLLMLPLDLEDKRRAMLGAFVNRFAIGFLVAVVDLPYAAWLKGLTVGALVSLPDAIITKSYAPILVIGAAGGTIIGLIVG